ncbi:hypothetical protein [Bernardetia litoralis]|uniref:hypothetical protein n=1 Tax=Bernardetia litoralis TaxID=999 RepID=UPI00031C805C|nr:hypothetical protein [Bernardetia litoralis]
MEETLQLYEILATDAIGNPTFIDFISTKVKSDDILLRNWISKIFFYQYTFKVSDSLFS